MALLARGVVVALFSGYAGGCAAHVVEALPDTSEGEAILAALEHVATIKWGQRETTTITGRAAVRHHGEKPLSESTHGFLDEAFEARGWRWSTEDPLVPTGNCTFPGGDCRLKNPTELHLAFSVVPASGEACAAEASGFRLLDGFCWEPVAGEERHGVHVWWLSSYFSQWLGGDQAELGGQGMLVTRGPEGWVVEVRMDWIT